MEKKRMSFKVAKMEHDKESDSYSGEINGDFCVMKKSTNGFWYITGYRDVTFFDQNQRTKKEDEAF